MDHEADERDYFHANFYNKGVTKTVVNSIGDFIFGGFSDKSWTFPVQY